MSARGLLDELLRTARSAMDGSRVTERRADGGRGLSELGKGALAGGALGLLLGNKKARKTVGRFAGYGGAAALGALAFKVYADWQRNQAGVAPAAARTLDVAPAEEAERQSRAVLTALVAAAKSDGHVDDRERQLIEAEMGRLEESDPALQGWLSAELGKPLDPAEVAAAADGPQTAAEMYLASVLAVDEQSWMERAYLDELGKRLGLDEALRRRLEEQARSVAGG